MWCNRLWVRLTRSGARGQKRRDAEEAKALKKLRKRWLKSVNQLDVDEWIARDEWRKRFPELREVIDWGQNLRMWFDRT